LTSQSVSDIIIATGENDHEKHNLRNYGKQGNQTRWNDGLDLPRQRRRVNALQRLQHSALPEQKESPFGFDFCVDLQIRSQP
jgi:hypothetical protein